MSSSLGASLARLSNEARTDQGAHSCATYLFSTPPVPHGRHAAVATDDESFWNGLIGTFFLLGYLFFDGLVSTTQERVFGKNPSSSDPFGPESPVLCVPSRSRWCGIMLTHSTVQ